MKRILVRRKLGKRKYALIDDEDINKINTFRWYAKKNRDTFYARSNNKVLMHRLIIEASKDDIVDHKNRNGLDNRKENLRIVTFSQNCINRKIQKNNKSGFRGVSYNRKTKNYRAYIFIDHKQIHIGTFNNAKDAARAYNKSAKLIHKEYAQLNGPMRTRI